MIVSFKIYMYIECLVAIVLIKALQWEDISHRLCERVSLNI